MTDLPKPVALATERGHTVVADGPTAGGASRWTCTECGRAVLQYAANIYGSAVEADCTPGERVSFRT